MSSAYAELRADGWLTTRRGAGSVARLPRELREGMAPRDARTPAGAIDLRRAAPAAPVGAFRAAVADATAAITPQLTSAGWSQGLPELRAGIAERHSRRGRADRARGGARHRRGAPRLMAGPGRTARRRAAGAGRDAHVSERAGCAARAPGAGVGLAGRRRVGSRPVRAARPPARDRRRLPDGGLPQPDRTADGRRHPRGAARGRRAPRRHPDRRRDDGRARPAAGRAGAASRRSRARTSSRSARSARPSGTACGSAGSAPDGMRSSGWRCTRSRRSSTRRRSSRRSAPRCCPSSTRSSARGGRSSAPGVRTSSRRSSGSRASTSSTLRPAA